MALTTKLRNLLAALLVFAVSPFSVCAQIACNVTCSLHSAGEPKSQRKGLNHEEVSADSVQHSDGMRCHHVAERDGVHPEAFLSRDRNCQLENCGVVGAPAAPANAQSERLTGQGPWAARLIGGQPSNAIALGVLAPTSPHRSWRSRFKFHDVLASCGTLRI